MRRVLVMTAVLIASQCGTAQAHFLFIRIGPAAEAGRAAEVFFSEIATAGDPMFIDKIAHTKLWQQAKPGEFTPLTVRKGADRLRAALPADGSVVVVGECQYGVIAREKQTPFLLRYFPKSVAGAAESLNQMQARPGSPFEIMATFTDEQITFVVLRDGKPLPGAVLTTVDTNLANEELSAGADGRAVWKPASPGAYAAYTRFVTKQAGSVENKKYEEIREFATIAFDWPLVRRGPDADAVAMFEETIATRASWRNFPGFTAKVAGEVDGRPFDGRVTISGNGTVEFATQETAAESWVSEQLESIVMHRRASDSSTSPNRPKPVLRFADDRADHPLGRLLTFDGGSFASSYRVKDKQIVVVNRHVGPYYMTITVLDNDQNAEGKFLPRSYTVQYWDAGSGELKRTETVQDRWQRFGSWDLPVSHQMTIASESGLAVRSMVLSGHELIKP